MRTAVDSSVLLDVVLDDPRHADRSEAALRVAASTGALLVGECVLAEIAPALGVGRLEEFLTDWELQFVPSTRQSATLAGEMFAVYLKRRAGRATRVLPDFLIGAHAKHTADRLLARDRGYYRDYFRDLEVISP
ncbi:MAG: type II toxin-antitoxin system VapC family toxin [Deltaproteobacteria bacterium]|nr:type II toxin-antitoxin system VapC family toxin [Deltaproteobacteria bacterium]